MATRCGIFGKLPSKRDFVAHGVPREFLNFWEAWLQSSVSASKVTLGDAWQQRFLTAPIWRFWLGSSFCGLSALGALMPSVDGVGRYFPLTIFACAPADAAIEPPVANAQEEWFRPVETALLHALDEGFAAEPASLVEELPYPRTRISDPPTPQRPAADLTVWSAAESDFAAAFAAIRAADEEMRCRDKSFWWTGGGSGVPSQILAFDRMPDPYRFAGFLSGFTI